MTIAAVILNYNSAEDCRKCVGFLESQRGVDLEIIVVDNASRKEDADAVKNLCEENGLVFIQAAENWGYNAGNNIGLRRAVEDGCRYALIANPDMEFPDPNYVKRLSDELEANPDVVTVGSDILTADGQHQNPMKADGDWSTSFAWIKDILSSKSDKDAWDFIDDYSCNHPCAKLSGCALMVNLSHLASIGYFDEYPFLYCEEAIFAKQTEQASLKMHYVADTTAIHRHITSAKGDPRPRFRQWRRSRLYFIRRYANYPWYGRLLASLSWRIYLGLMIVVYTFRK